jgi:hypothetical protein
MLYEGITRASLLKRDEYPLQIDLPFERIRCKEKCRQLINTETVIGQKRRCNFFFEPAISY